MIKMPMMIRFAGLIFLLFVCAGCSKYMHVDDDSRSRLESAFEKLGLTKQGLDYPNKEILAAWEQSNSYSRTYLEVQEGKKELLGRIKADPERVLAFTLDTICRKCSQDTDAMEDEKAALDVQLRCAGAITALYFFNDADQDKIIRNRLLNASNTVIDKLTYFQYEWFYNRPNPNVWFEAIDKIPEDRVDKDLKDTLVYFIKKAIQDPNPEKFGVML